MAGHSFEDFIENMVDVTDINENDPLAFFIQTFVQPTDILLTIDNVKKVVREYGLTYSDANYKPEPSILDKFFASEDNIKVKNKDLSDLEVYEINSQKEKIDSTYKTFISNFRQTSVIIFFVILLFI
jgi:hypothetical protein